MLVGQVAPLALAATPAPAARALAPAAPVIGGGVAGDHSRGPRAAAPAPVAAPVITATKADSFTDGDGDSKAEPGQEISYEVVVSNTGTAATGVQFSDTIDANTTLVPGSLTASPLARDDSYNTQEDTQLVVSVGTGVLTNDFGVPSPTAIVGSGATTQGGTFSLAADGSFTYDPPAGFDGTDSFTYTATNGNSPDNGATVTITVGPVDDAPTAVDDSATVAEDSGATPINVIANDTDPDGGTNTIQSVTQPTNGTVVITNAGADLTYQPNANYCNNPPGTTLDTFTYTLNGGDSGTVSVTVTCQEDNPTAVNDSATVAEDSGATTINVIANDTDPDGGTKTIQSVTQPANGAVVITNAGADLTYQPNANYCNNPPGTTLDTFTYTLSPGGSTGTVSVTVTCVDDAPTAVNDSATVPEDSGATPINVIANDTDPDGGTNTIQSVTQPTNGTVVITNAGADLTYQPNANYCNNPPGTTLDTFTYTLSPGGSTGTVSVTVTCLDDAPTAVNDSATVAEDSGATTINVIANDTDPDGGTKTIQSVTQGTNGTVTITNSGADLTYQPNANFNGSDSFTYTLNGGSIGTVNVTVTEVNDAPTADNETLSDVFEDSGTFSVPFSTLLTGDTAGPSNESGQTLNVTGVSNFTGGTAVINGTNVDFTPTANFCGAAGFTYTVTDNGTTNGSSDPKSANGTVSFNVTCVNDAPSFTKGPDVTVNEDSGPQTVNPWATAISAGPGETQNLTFEVTANTNTGLFSAGPAVSSSGALTFTSAPNAFGTATITIRLKDDGGTANGGADTSATQTFVITVNPVNDPPVAGADAWDHIGNTVLEVDAANDFTPEPTVYVSGTVLTNDNDPVEGNPVAVTGVVGCADTTGPSFDNCATANGGSVNINADGTFIFRPKAGDTAASDSFQYILTDTPNVGEGDPASVNGTVTLTRKGRVWYVNNQQPDGGNGTSAAPFDTLAEADTAATTNGDTIYVFFGDGTTNKYNTGVSLTTDQRLIGQGVALSMPLSVNGTNPYPLLDAGSTPLITNSAGNAVTVSNATGVEIRGLSISATGNAIDLTASGASNAGLTVANNAITGSGAAQEGIDINGTGTGTVTVDVQNNTLAANGNAFDAVNTSTGTLNIVFSNNTGITATAGNGVVVNGGSGAANITGFSGNTVSGATAGAGVSITNARFDATPGGNYNTVNAGDTEIGTSGDRVGGAGLVLTNVTGDLNFDTDLDVFSTAAALQATSPVVFNGSNAGLRVQVNSNAGTLNSNGGAAIDALRVQLNLSPVTVVSSNSTTFGVNFDDTDGSTFSTDGGSSIASMTTASAIAFRVSSSTGTYTYNGIIATAGSKGVELNANTGATISFTNDLTVSSGTGTAFNANTGGTVSVTDSGGIVNTLATTTGTALNFVNTTIGTGGINFKSISATAGPVNGIVLTNTGTTAGLSVLGDGSNNSGGTITNASGDAISLTNTRNVVLDELNIQNPGGDGIDGRQVTNFTITDSTIDSAGDSNDESAIAFNNNKTTDNNLAGTLVVTGNTLTNSYYSGLDVQSGDGTITNANVSNNTITNTTNGFGIDFVGSCTASTCFNLDNADINQNNISGVRGAGVQVQVSGANTGTLSPRAGVPGDATKRIDITNNSIQLPTNGNNSIVVATAGLIPAARAQMNFLIECNGNNTAPCTSPTATPLNSGLIGTVILIGNNGYADMVGTVNNNRIAASHTDGTGGGGAAGQGIGGGNGVPASGSTAYNPQLTLSVTNNVISGTDGNGILLVSRGASGHANLKITGNNVAAPLSASRPGIRVDAGNNASADDSICLNISGNTTSGNDDTFDAPGIGIRKEGTNATVNDFGIVGLSPSPTTRANAEDRVSTDNPGSELGDSSVIGVQKRTIGISGDNYVNCNTAPSGPVGFDAATAGAATAAPSSSARKGALQMDTQRLQTPDGSRSWADTDPRPTFGLINGKFVTIPEPQSAPAAAPSTPAPAAPPAVNTPAPAAAPAPAPRLWSDMPVIRVIRTPQPAATPEEAKDEDEEKKAEEQNEATDVPAPAAPEGKQKPAKKAVRQNISYVGPLGAASYDTPRFVNASYSRAGDVRADRARQAKATPRAAAAARAAAAPFAGETVNVTIGNMANADSVTIRFRVTVNTPFTATPEEVSNQGLVTYNESGTSVLTDDPSVGGATDKTVTPVDATRFITVNDAQVPEPSTGTVDMMFTISLSAPAPAAVSVNYATSDGTATAGTCGSGGDYESKSDTVTFATGEQVKTINVPVCSDAANDNGETFTLTLSSPSGGTISDGTATGTITANTPGTILISEIRTSGPGGAGDDYVELYNNTNADIDISGYGLFKMGANCSATPVRVAAIPGALGSNTTVLKARGHYLLAGSQYSLKDYGGTNAAKEDQLLSADLEADANVGFFSTSDPAAISTINRLDAVGFGINVGGNCDLLREPSNLPGAAGSTTEHTYFRKLCDIQAGVGCSIPGNPKDSNANSEDFTFANTNASAVLNNPQRLGAPGPENASSPTRRDDDGLTVELLDRGVAPGAPPNRVRNLGGMSNPPNETFGTLIIRRRVVNNTGSDVSRLRFRISQFTTAPNPPGIADLRALTGSNESSISITNDSATCFDSTGSATPSCVVNVTLTTLETPPAQSMGGGLNSTLSSGTITMANKLQNGKSINVNFKLGVDKTGTFRFLIVVEALP